MPTNLNALIRYKTIDKCLGNRLVKCTIRRLREECSEALGEKRGIYKTVSERTIRDDIRVMRSDILGFNAPIAFEDGCYFYTEKDYSIFKTYIKGRELLQSVFQLLLEQRSSISKPLINALLIRIAKELDIVLPPDIYSGDLAERKETGRKRDTSDNAFMPGLDAETAQAVRKRSSQQTKSNRLQSGVFDEATDFLDSMQTTQHPDVYEMEVEPQVVDCSFSWRFVFDAIAASTDVNA
ncbi:MAG TPA: hypothetical protein PK939_10310 [Bacteroidales bacterium]|nr:hypothetical protein [Bacteroidales bacterium]